VRLGRTEWRAVVLAYARGERAAGEADVEHDLVGKPERGETTFQNGG
jgi:hypothetical protein